MMNNVNKQKSKNNGEDDVIYLSTCKPSSNTNTALNNKVESANPKKVLVTFSIKVS